MLQPVQRQIIIVDDEPCIADSLAAIFRLSGYHAAAFYDGQAALEVCRVSPPDLLLADVTMPGINGIELAILIQELCPSCKILLFSGLTVSFDLVQRANRQGHQFEILEKPVQPAELLQKVAASFVNPPLPFPQPGAAPRRRHG